MTADNDSVNLSADEELEVLCGYALTEHYADNPWQTFHHAPSVAGVVLDAVPSGWLKTDDGWVKFEPAVSCENYCGFCLVHDEPWPCKFVEANDDRR